MKSFVQGVTLLLLAQIVVKIMGVTYRLVITNMEGFGDTGNGLYGAGYQIYALLLSISSIGVPNAISKLVSERMVLGKKKEAHDIFRMGLSLFFIIGLIASIFLFCFAGKIASWMGNEAIKGILVALSPAIVFVAIASVIRGYFNGMGDMRATSRSQMMEQFLKCVLTVLLVQQVGINFHFFQKVIPKFIAIPIPNKTVGMAIAGNLASSLAAILGCIYLCFFTWKHQKREGFSEKETITKKEKIMWIKRILAMAIPIAATSIIAGIYRNIDTFTVVNCLKNAMMKSATNMEKATEEATRLYGILSGKIDILIGMPAALNIAFATALVPAIAGAMAKGELKKARQRFIFSVRTTLLIAFPCTVGLYVLAEPILQLLFPNASSPEAIQLLKMSSCIILFSLWNQTLTGALQGVGKVTIPVKNLLIGCGIKLGLNIFLIPHVEWQFWGGINGAAMSSLVAIIITFLLNQQVAYKSFEWEETILQTMIKPAIAALLMGVVAYYGNALLKNVMTPSLSTVIAIMLAGVVDIILILGLHVFGKEDDARFLFWNKWKHFFQQRKMIKAQK